jgi:penicillin amidase
MDLMSSGISLRKFLTVLIGGILLLLMAIWFGGRWVLSFSTADYNGEIELSGISRPIEITFDQKGIPQIWAESNQDLYFALGWVHASERLFQMELIRRFAAGELSEIFGKVAYPIDVIQRKMGFMRKAQRDFANLNPQTLLLLHRYCAGINSWVEHKSVLPPEFVIMRLSPPLWKPTDCLSIALYQTWYSNSLMNDNSRYHQLVEDLGGDLEQVLIQNKDWSPAIVYHGQPGSGFPLSPPLMTLASNSWTISPDKSLSGKAIHACDPHLIINQIPGFWYAVGLHSQEGTSEFGVTVPGLPFVAMGHTDKIAFGFNVAAVDLVDYYVEKRDSTDSLQVLTPGGRKKMEVVTEEITVKDIDNPKVEKVFLTPNGVVVEKDEVSVASLKWAGFDFSAAEILNAAFQLPMVDNFEDFRKVVTSMGALDVNWSYSDKEGNIGYQLGSPIPIRDYPQTFSRLQGENPLHQWKGYRTLDQKPYDFNPAKGWIASCNNQIVPDNWPYKIPGFFDPYRIVRISKLLGQDVKFSRSEMSKMQLDWVSVSAQRWKELMKQGAEKLNMDSLAQSIDTWNGVMFKNGKVPAIFAFWWEFLAYPLFYDDLGRDWRLGRPIQEEVMSANLPQLIDNVNTVGVQETLTDISAIALDSALEHTNNRTYGEEVHLNITHPLSQVKLLDYWFHLNRGPFAMGGDFSCINANWTVFDSKTNQFSTLVGPSMRFVLDWANVDSLSFVMNLGQSGNPFSPHYDDFLDMWLNGETWTVPFSKDKVYETKAGLLRMIPSNSN